MRRQVFEIGVGGIVFTVAALLGVGHIFDVLDKFMPERMASVITDKVLILTMIAGLVVAVIGWFDYKHEKGKQHGTSPESPHAPPITNTNTATATGGSVHITNTFQVPVDELAEAVAKRVRQEILNPGDGFVQIDDKRLELQIPSNPLQAGQTFSLKYFCENRGGLPVYDVQSWGILNILSPELNSMDHLKRVMRDSAIQGRDKFPNHGSTLGAGGESFNYAVLAEPLTDEQIHGMRAGTLSLFFVVGGVWRDNDNKFHYWSDGRKGDFPNFPNVSPSTWRG